MIKFNTFLGFLISLIITLLIFATSLSAQNITNYTFSAASGTYTPLTSGTTMELSGGTVDDGWFNNIPIGFTFVYMGTPFTTVSTSTNGWLTFGQNISTSIVTNNLTSGTPRPFIAPLWDDLDLQVNTNFSYKTEGSAPNRIFTAEWKNMQWNYAATGNTISFQVKLYEATGAIEFIYNDEGGTVNSGSASIGITALTGSGSGTFLSLDGTGSSPTASSTTETTTLNTKPASGQTYTFTPPAAPADPTGLSFSGVTVSSMTLNWTDNATNETGYLIYRSLDNSNFTLVTSLAANSTSYTATGLTPNTTYYWRVYAVNEGRLSSALSGAQTTNTVSLSGTRTIGATGDYGTLTAAIADIQNQGLAGSLTLEFLSDYAGGETYPIVLTNLTTTSSNTLTIRPATGVTGISLSGSSTNSIIRIENEDYVIIDGRPGGSGTNREITITNAGNGPTVLFIDDASNNTLRFLNIVGSANTSNTSGVVMFSTTTRTTGNDNNTIEYCDINANGSAVGIYSAGTTGKENDGNTIQNNRIRDFYINATSTTSTYGIRISTASTNFLITGNSLYQTSSRAYSTTTAIHYGISLNNTSGYFTVTNNYIGGSDVNCGGTAYTISSGSARFWAIEVNVGTTSSTSIQGNTIQNFNISSGFTTSGSTLFGGIVITAGQTNIGTASGNIIGSTSGTSININLTGAATGPIITGIATTGGTPHTINNNIIAGITVNASSTTAYGNLYAISLGSSGSVTTLEGNTIGSSTGQIINNSGSGAVTTQYVTVGIRATAGSGTTGLTINNNTIQYLSMPAGASNTGATLYGIQLTSTGTVYTVTNNTIRNLTTGSARTNSASSASLIGINHQGTTSPTIIRSNTIHSLSQTAASAAVVVYGIYCSGTTTGNFELSGNFVHSISLATSSTSAVLEGIYINTGIYRVFNNMVRLGIDAGGNSVSGNFSISGIRKATTTANTIVFNSVYIGGTVASSSMNTFAMRRSAVSTTDSIFNNIFVNSRSNTSGTARHYAITTSSTSGLEDNNIFFANGTGGAVGSVDGGTTAQTTLFNYQSAFAGRNGNSGYGNPNYINATGDASSVNLHVQNPTPVEGQGSTAFNYITTDFDGSTRSSLTPVDIGADADNFTLADIFPPSISYTGLLNTASTSNRILASVTITDATGVPTSGTLQPRIWFRRSAPTETSWGSTQGSLTSGSGTNGVWSFTIDYSVIGVSPVSGETYQYYIVAQDEASTPNIVTNPNGGNHVDVNTQTSAPPSPNSYSIVPGYSGTVYVGTGQTYTTLTGNSGLFQALNGGVLTGNVTAVITSDITTEDGTNALNQLVSEGGDFTLTISPSEATERVISGNVSTGLIRLNGADNVTIDGRYSGSGKYLRFRNTNTSGSTITLLNDASNNLIRDCYIEGATTSTSNGVIFFSTGSTTGNDNNIIQNCVIRDRSDAAGVPANLVYSSGSSATITNTGNSLLNNELFNFTSNGINLTSTGNENWTITGNEIYQTAARTTILYGILFNSLGTNTISQNTIRDMNTSGEIRGISLGDARNTTVSRNKINQTTINGSTSTWTGIYFAGSSGNPASVTLVNNQITLIPATESAQTIRGIYDYGYSGNSINVYYNSIYVGGTATGSTTWGYLRGTSTPTTATLKNNVFVNNRSGGSVNHFACGDQSHGSGTFNVSNNFYSGLGTTAANFMDRGTSSTGTPESFSSWKANKSDNFSYGVTASVVTYTNLFADYSTGNLNIISSNEECWLVNGKGVAISGIADDFGATGVRSTSSGAATDIGSDEFTPTGGGATPPAATPSAAPSLNIVTTYSVYGNTNVSISWGGSGTVPTDITCRYYSGVQPSGPGTRANFYWDITPTGGSGYSYDITLTYDEGQLNGIAENNLHPAISADGGSTWTAYLTEGTNPGQFQRNTTNNTITIYGLTGFSIFGLGDINNPLPVELTSFVAKVKDRDVILEWQTATEQNTSGFEIERKLINEKDNSLEKWEKVGFVRGSGISNKPVQYSFEDKKLNTGKYMYRLKMVDIDGSFEYSNEVRVEIGKPAITELKQNYPNSFNPETKIEYQLSNPSKVRLEVYNITGELVTVLVDKELDAGYYMEIFNANKVNGGLASGVYIYRMIANDLVLGKTITQTKKMLLIK